MSWFMYILRCADGRLYTGMTSDLQRRIREHQVGMGGRYTRGQRPVQLVYHEQCASEIAAKRRERQVKPWSIEKKLALMAGDRQRLQEA